MDVHQALPVDGKNIATKVMCHSNGKFNYPGDTLT
jgi:hypothetical protein